VMNATTLCPTCWTKLFPETSQSSEHWTRGEAGCFCSICNPAPRVKDNAGDVEVCRKYQCVECGYRHTDGVTVTVEWATDDCGEPVKRAGTYASWFACDECGTEQVVTTRVSKKDLGQ
jgi:predicted RNA-binding Zn-ribbon protein involved in translation (DUF1610 family)